MNLRGYLLAVILCSAGARANWSNSGLGAYSVATLADESVVRKLQARFHATGTPVFLLANPSGGLQQGDILRFTDRAFLVDPSVWQTLSSEGALNALRQSPLVRVKATATPAAWTSRARIATGTKDRKLYEFGAVLLKSLEQSVGTPGEGQKLFLSVEGGQLVLTAPTSFVDQLKSVKSDHAEPSREKSARGIPRWVGDPPPDTLWMGQSIDWTGWAVDDSGGATSGFVYQAVGEPPTGIRWNPNEHRLVGTPTAEGRAKVDLMVLGDRGADTIRWTPLVRRHAPPRLEGDPAPVVCGKPWSFRPIVLSRDWPSQALSLRRVAFPPGAVWDSGSGTLGWNPPDSLCGKSARLEWRLEDPVGLATGRAWTISVQGRETRISTDGLRIDLPWDTLLEGRWYTWDAGRQTQDWLAAGTRLDSVGGGNVQALWDGKVLRFRPLHAGNAEIRFSFRENGRTRVVAERRIVKPYLPPVFKGYVGGSVVGEGDIRSYRPIAEDPQGGPIHFLADIPSDAPIDWDGKEFVVAPHGPGMWAVRLEARDTLDQVREKWIAFQSRSRWSRAFWLESRVEAGANPWVAGWDFGSGRFGLFTPSLQKLFGWTHLHDQDWPFLFGGLDFLGAESRREGSEMSFDLGMTLRAPDPKIVTGGYMLRIRGKTASTRAKPLSVEGEVLGWVRQGILLTDTSGIARLFDTSDIPGEIQRKRDQYGPILDRFLREAFDRRNIVVLSSLEAWYRLPWFLGVGAGLWRQDLPVAGTYEQRLSSGLRFRPTGRWGTLTAEARGGWGPGVAGWSTWFDLGWSSRILP